MRIGYKRGIASLKAGNVLTQSGKDLSRLVLRDGYYEWKGLYDQGPTFFKESELPKDFFRGTSWTMNL